MIRTLILLLISTSPAAALTLALPEGAEQTVAKKADPAEYTVLTGRADMSGAAPKQLLTGARTDNVWTVPAASAQTLDLITTFREQIVDDGYRIIYECTTDVCGGFDFRYAMDLTPEPEMHVDLGDFRYITARKGPEWIALTVSRSAENGFVQLTSLTQSVPTVLNVSPTDTTSLTEQITTQGHVVLEDLRFASGAATLEDGDYTSLRDLARYLTDHPTAKIILVGHTDTTGTAASNVALSRARAQSVMERLIEARIPRAQLSAEGAGWIAPRTSNATPEGRAQNRRVEAVLIINTP